MWANLMVSCLFTWLQCKFFWELNWSQFFLKNVFSKFWPPLLYEKVFFSTQYFYSKGLNIGVEKVPWPGVEPGPCWWERQILTARPSGTCKVEMWANLMVSCLFTWLQCKFFWELNWSQFFLKNVFSKFWLISLIRKSLLFDSILIQQWP